MEFLTIVTLWVAAISCGLMAGVYFSFSIFVMRALAKIEAASAIAAMQSINKVIVSSAFLPLFFGSTLASLILTGTLLSGQGTGGTLYAAVGGFLYFTGMTICTMVFNVPLNNRLAVLHPETREATVFWRSYLQRWTRLNHVRTASSTLATLLFIAAITAAEHPLN